MKKISLENMKNVLTRDEMKKIVGGLETSKCHKCCWDAYPNDCSACIPSSSNAICKSGASLKDCACSA